MNEVNHDEPLKINMFGSFSLSYKNNTIDDNTNRFKKIWFLLEYLITFREKNISQNELIETLWPDEDLTDPANNLKTLIHRARTTLDGIGFEKGKNIIRFSRGSYSWNNDLNFEIDAEIFSSILINAKGIKDERYRLEEELVAINMYKGTYLPKSSLEPWAVPISTYYHNLYLEAVYDAIKILSKEQNYKIISDICTKATLIDPYNEELHYEYILSLTKQNLHHEALNHYEFVVDMFYKQFGLNLSDKITKLYKNILNTTKEVEYDITLIKENLKEGEYNQGAYFCELGLFKELCQIESRAIARTGVSIHLALISITSNYVELDNKIMNSTMDKLHTSIQESLRRGDVFTRYSLSQFLVLLPSTNIENAQMVVNRIEKSFKRRNIKDYISVKNSISQLEPNLK